MDQGTGVCKLHLGPSPWRKSWTFGFDRRWHNAVESTRTLLRAMIYGSRYPLYETSERELHVSWN